MVEFLLLSDVSCCNKKIINIQNLQLMLKELQTKIKTIDLKIALTNSLFDIADKGSMFYTGMHVIKYPIRINIVKVMGMQNPALLLW
jgi:hypothetical protein